MSKNTGGAAFPWKGDCATYHEGMTLRDYFAAKAMIGLIQFGSRLDDKDVPEEAPLSYVVASQAYGIADAMIAEREKK